MIQLEAATWKEILSPTTKIETRVTWSLGGAIDVSDRIIEVSGTSAAYSPFLEGYRVSPVSLVLDNSDGLFSLSRTAGSIIANSPPEQLYLTRVDIDIRVHRDDGTYEDIDSFVGFVTYVRFRASTVELRIDDIATTVLQSPLPEEIPISHDPADSHTALQLVKDLIDDHTVFDTTTDVVASSFNTAAGVLSHIDWPITGTIPKGTAIGDAIDALARTGLCTVYPNEAGKLVFFNEFPELSGILHQPRYSFPHEINSSNAGGFEIEEGMAAIATEVTVRYRGVSATYRDTSLEADIGRQSRTVDMPFLAFYRQARWAARFLYEMHGGFERVARFTTGALGLPMQVNDWVTIRDPHSDVAKEYRIVSKSWDGSRVAIEAATFGHKSSIVQATFNRWGTSTWATGAVL